MTAEIESVFGVSRVVRRNPDQVLRRLRPGRGRGARHLSARAAAVGQRGHTAQCRGMDHDDGEASGHRPHPSGGASIRQGGRVSRLESMPEQLDDWSDDRLRLIFTCCHPALALESRVALTLRIVCGLSTAEVGRAFLTSEATIAQRLVRAKHKIKVAGIAYEVPQPRAARRAIGSRPLRRLPALQRGVRSIGRPAARPRRALR